MAACGYCLSRRAFVLGTLSAIVTAGSAGAQAPVLTAEEIGRGRLDYAEAVGGPAELITLRLTFPPGAVTPWHFHPGTVEGIITAGTLTIYEADGCKASQGELWPRRGRDRAERHPPRGAQRRRRAAGGHRHLPAAGRRAAPRARRGAPRRLPSWLSASVLSGWSGADPRGARAANPQSW